jgi:hypothetical protein
MKIAKNLADDPLVSIMLLSNVSIAALEVVVNGESSYGGIVTSRDDLGISSGEGTLDNGQDTEVSLLNGEFVGRLLDRHDVDHLGVSTVDWKNLNDGLLDRRELVGRVNDRHDLDHLGVSSLDGKNLDVLTRKLVGWVVDDSSITAGEGAVVVDQPSVTTGK